MLHLLLNMNDKIKKTPTSKGTKLFDNLSKLTEQYITGKAYSPMTRAELMKRLSLPKIHREIYIEVLDDLVKAGAIKFTKNRYAPKQSNRKSFVGPCGSTTEDSVLSSWMTLHSI